jgi:hypothetical protein
LLAAAAAAAAALAWWWENWGVLALSLLLLELAGVVLAAQMK